MSDLVDDLNNRVGKWRLNKGGCWVNTPLKELRAAVGQIEVQSKTIAEMKQLLRDLDLGRSIHNERHPDQKIEGGLWDKVKALTALQSPPNSQSGVSE